MLALPISNTSRKKSPPILFFFDEYLYIKNNDRNVVKAYYTAGVIYDVLLTFGELSEEATDKRKYAKYKAAYIHNCLKSGETPIPGPPGESDENNENESDTEASSGTNNNFVASNSGSTGGGMGFTPPNNDPSPVTNDQPLINIPSNPQPFFEITGKTKYICQLKWSEVL